MLIRYYVRVSTIKQKIDKAVGSVPKGRFAIYRQNERQA